ncbi:MAG: hypothetical protein ABEJ57_01690 [Halobacteriaceae archaeon]
MPSRRQTLSALGTALLAGCTFRGLGRAAHVILVENDRGVETTVHVRGIDTGTGDQLINATRTIPPARADTVPDPTDLDGASGAAVRVTVETEDGLRSSYEWTGGAAGGTQQLQVVVDTTEITFRIGAATLPETTG